MNAESPGPRSASLGDEIVGRIGELAAISETPQHLARIFLTREHRAAADLLDVSQAHMPAAVSLCQLQWDRGWRRERIRRDDK